MQRGEAVVEAERGRGEGAGRERESVTRKGVDVGGRDARSLVSMSLCIKTLTGKSMHLENVSPLSTVAELKRRIEAEEEIPRDQIRLICAGVRG